MANLIDYLAWRGDVPLEVSPWNELDSLLAAVLSYLDFHGVQDPRGWTLREAKRIDLLIPNTGATFPNRKKMFEMMADSPRFGDCRMHHQLVLTDEGLAMQFSAMCMDLPDGAMAVMFRGTDNTLVGWREDLNMADQTRVVGRELPEKGGKAERQAPAHHGPQQGRQSGGIRRGRRAGKNPAED